MPFIIIFIIEAVLTRFANDISFMSKFRIISYALDYISSASIGNILFGLGIGNAVDAIGIGAHNLLVTYFIESGLIGLMLFLILVTIIIYYLRLGACVVVMPFIIASMSLGTTAIPYFFTFAFLCVLYKMKNLILF